MAIPSGMIDEIIKSMCEVVKNELIMLWGFKDEFLKLNKKLGKIKRVLHDAENKEFQDQAIREWLVELKDLMYDIEDIIDDCYIHINNNTTTTNNTTSPPMSRPSSSTTTSFKKGKRMISKKISAFYKKGKGVVHRHKIGKRIQEINVRLEEINKDRKDLQLAQIEGFIPPPPTSQWSRETTPYVIDSDITGIDDDAKVMVQKLTGSFGGGGGGGRVFAIVGMGGIGKTTLAQKVFNKCTEVGEKIWVCVSQNFNEIDILKQIIRSAGGNYGVTQTKQDFYSIVKKVLGGKRFLLVLDDLWSDRVWDEGLRIPFSDFTEDCQVLITTRNREIARQMGAVYIHEMKTLSDDDAWSHLRKIVHLDGETEEIDSSMKDLGMKIVKECKGLPLAIKAIGGRGGTTLSTVGSNDPMKLKTKKTKLAHSPCLIQV
ncbi:putative disease resistance protein RGA1 [Acorus calamus]|uniref:Disease resistance protein RGA1 n=1 Tax=Acorus calamus TaxID=4465 RepID=A0AAV9C234_ACOCL|nr:putative disease resistance protein RGA1 [Acorus calamus]